MVERCAPATMVAVLGGGPAGLAAAWQLARGGRRVVVFEQQAQVGGLGGGRVIDGNIYEYGPHLFHTTDEEIRRDIMTLAGDILFPVNRPILIKFRGGYFKYPLSLPDVLRQLPLATIVAAGASFLYENIRALLWPAPQENSETVLLRGYGRVLYEIFFKSYITHVWGIPPAVFSAKFAHQRIPRLSAIDVFFTLGTRLRRLVTRRMDTANFVENVEGPLYSTTRGFSTVAERMADEIKRLGGEVLTGTEVTRLQRAPDGTFRVALATGEHPVDFAAVITTLPLDELVRRLVPAVPESVLQAADRLQFRAITFVGLLVARPCVLPAALMYFREQVFNRLTDLSYFGFTTVPVGCTLLIAEITCAPGDLFFSDDNHARDMVIAELIREQLLARDEVRAAHVYRTAHAYPVFALGFEQQLATISRELDSYGKLFTVGRQGRFQYVNMHVAIRMGYDAAAAVEAVVNGG